MNPRTLEVTSERTSGEIPEGNPERISDSSPRRCRIRFDIDFDFDSFILV